MPNPRNLNHPLGAIGAEMKGLAARKFGQVPPIQCVVVNKRTGFPGEGIGWFTGDAAKFRRSTPSEQRKVMREMLSGIYEYSRWDTVLAHYGLEPSTLVTSDTLATEAAEAVRRYGKGEGPEHRGFKDYVAAHPELFGLPPGLVGEVEHPFPSADRLDVLFRHDGRLIGIEVKGPVSDDLDLGRGLFQCIKYMALLEAEQKVLQERLDVEMFLAICRELPSDLGARKAILGVDVQVIPAPKGGWKLK